MPLDKKIMFTPDLSIKDGTRYFYPFKMIIGTSSFQRVLYKTFMKNVHILRKGTACK
jgi:hypothetical protein